MRTSESGQKVLKFANLNFRNTEHTTKGRTMTHAIKDPVTTIHCCSIKMDYESQINKMLLIVICLHNFASDNHKASLDNTDIFNYIRFLAFSLGLNTVCLSHKHWSDQKVSIVGRTRNFQESFASAIYLFLIRCFVCEGFFGDGLNYPRRPIINSLEIWIFSLHSCVMVQNKHKKTHLCVKVNWKMCLMRCSVASFPLGSCH